jgi:cell division transport system ATP-binding protein
VSVIRLEHVTKTYPASSRPALEDISVEIDKGEFVFLVGSSGSGKSTFLRLLLKEETATSGTVHVAGKDVGKLSNWKVRRCAARSAACSRTSACCRTRRCTRTSPFALEVIGKSSHTVSDGRAGGARAGRARDQGQAHAGRAVGR